MTPKILVAIQSCHRDREAQQAQRDTWLSALSIADYKFFLGRPETKLQCMDEVFLDADDNYEQLSVKTQMMCWWALDHDYDWMFKCDIDTVLNGNKATISGGQDYVGGENADVDIPGFPPGRIEFCSGGAGYWLSRKALTIVVNHASIPTCAEDVFVAHVLKEAGITPIFQPGYKWRPGSDIDSETISLHLSSALQKKYEPDDMHKAYEKIKRFQNGKYRQDV